MRFAFVDAEKATFPVAALCRVLGVTRQGYYAYAKRPASDAVRSEVELHGRIRALHAASRQTYGSPRIHRALRAEGIRVGKPRVERAMRGLELRACGSRRFRITTKADSSHRTEPNVLARDFSASRPNERWVTDITYVWTDEGWCYLAVVLDLYSRSVVGWTVHETLHTKLALDALEMAVRRRRPQAGLLHHSDRGCQYTSAEYRERLRRLGVTVSMSRRGNCWDNAVAESFFSTLKKELLHRRRWSGRLELRDAAFDYIEAFYNRRRLHSTLGYKTPAQVEDEYASAQAA